VVWLFYRGNIIEAVVVEFIRVLSSGGFIEVDVAVVVVLSKQ
jgi:hypothetical protein